MIAIVPGMLASGIVLDRRGHLRAAMVRRAQLGRDRRVAAQRQSHEQQQQDQGPGNVAHAENAITGRQRRSFSTCRAQL